MKHIIPNMLSSHGITIDLAGYSTPSAELRLTLHGEITMGELIDALLGMAESFAEDRGTGLSFESLEHNSDNLEKQADKRYQDEVERLKILRYPPESIQTEEIK